MPIDIVEMWWSCLVCSEHVLGRHKNCTNCGAPRKPDCPEWMPDDISPAAAVRDPKLLEKFRSGPDWKCRYCDSSQYKADGTCARCGASQTEGTPDPVASPPKPLPPRPRARKNFVQIPYPAQDVYRQNATPTILDEPDPIPLPVRSWSRPEFIRNGCVGAGSILLIILAYILFSTHEVEARVVSVNWTRTAEIQRYQINQHEGWYPDSCSISTENLGQRVHHYDRVAVGSHKESYQESYACGTDVSTVPGSCTTTARTCTSNRNGSATCSGGDRVCSPSREVRTTRYCSRTAYNTVTDYENQPRYQTWYAWKVWEWTHNRNIVARGATTTVRNPVEDLAPTLSIGQQERTMPPTSEYEVHLSNGEESLTFRPESEPEFRLFGPESSHRFRVGILRSTELIR